MTVWRLAARTLSHRWSLSLLTIFCLALASSVLLGALLVGSSIRASLHQRLVDPLGPITHAYVSPSFLDPSRVQTGGALVLRFDGSAQNQHEEQSGGVTCWGLDESFLALMGSSAWRPAPGRAWVTKRLAQDLRLKVGDPVFIRIPDPDAPAAQAVFARKSPLERTLEVQVEVGAILPDRGIARFDLTPSFQSSKAIFVPRPWLCEKIGKPDSGNAVLGPSPQLLFGMTLADYGLSLIEAKNAGGWVLQSDGLVLSDDHLKAAEEAGGGRKISIALADRYAIGAKAVSYGVAAWIEGFQPSVNEWAASDLGAQPGSSLRADLLLSRADGSFGRHQASAKIADVLPMKGVGGEPAFVPAIKGVTNAAKVSDWDPPFPIDHKRITQRDEEYWSLHRAAPRLLLARDDLKAAWNGRESITGVWLKSGSRDEIEQKLVASLDRSLPLRTADLRAAAIKAAQGSTDMTSLILALGFFLMLGALGLAGSAFRLMVRQESKGIALLAGLGIPENSVKRVFLAEGVILGGVGSVLGLGGGIAFAALSLLALRLLMPSVFGSENLELRVDVILCASSLLGSLLFAAWPLSAGFKEAKRMALVQTLRGGSLEHAALKGSSAWAPWLAGGAAVFAGSFALEAPGRSLVQGFGVFCLVMGILAWQLSRPIKPSSALTFARLAWRLAQESRSSLLLTIFLSGMAAFMLAAVASQIRFSGEPDNRLILRTTLPLEISLNSPEGRKRMGFNEDELNATEGMESLAFLVGPGEDASCLNPAKPARPRFIGLPPEAALAKPFPLDPPDAWQILASQETPNPAPAVGDHDTVVWTLLSGLGKSMPWEGARSVRFAGLIQGSPLAREIMVSQADFQAAYPSITAPSLFLITPPQGRDLAEITYALKTGLAPLGPQVTKVEEELTALRSVQNAYMALFFALGALGLILGVAGTAFASAREALARRQQYALMKAVGLSGGSLTLLALVPGAIAGLGGSLLGVFCGSIGMLSSSTIGPFIVLLAACSGSVALSSLWVAAVLNSGSHVESLRSE